MKFLLILVFAFNLCVVTAQNQTPKQVSAYEAMKRWSVGDQTNGKQMPLIPMSPGERVNEVYLDIEWKKASIAVYTTAKLLDGWPVKYDLRANAIEININKELKVLDARLVKSMMWIDSIGNVPHNFVNGKEFRIDGVPLTSLIEVIVEGKLALYKQYTYWIKKPDFNPALNVGSVDERIYKKSLFYYSSGKDLHPVPQKKKGLAAVFGDKASLVSSYMETNDLDLRAEADLERIFVYYNSLQ
jgi:hypothetical protein